MTDAPEFLRAGDIARLTGVSVRTVRRWIAEETLPSVKLRRRAIGSQEGARTPAVAAAPQTWIDAEDGNLMRTSN